MAQVQTDFASGPPLSECIEKYLATREQDLDARTLNQHRLALERLQRFLEARNIIHIREMTVDHLETFKTAGLPKPMRMTTKATTFAKIRCFLRAAFRRGWIKEGLVDKVTTVKAVYDQKEPTLMTKSRRSSIMLRNWTEERMATQSRLARSGSFWS